MAFDGITVAALARELDERITGGRIYKIAQTDRLELLLTIKPTPEKGGGQVRLYLSADPSLPLAYFTSVSRQAPLNAPAFCMLLRKHLQNGRILSVEQPGLERILRIRVSHMDEMGDPRIHTLVIELMGKHSNIIFLDEEDQIVDSIKRVSSLVSSVREVLPGRPYFVPQTRGKEDPFTVTPEAFRAAAAETGKDPAAFLSGRYTGLSPLMAQELCWRAGVSDCRSAAALTPSQTQALYEALTDLMETVKKGDFSPVLYSDRGTPSAFSAVPLQMMADLDREDYSSVSMLLEAFYARRNTITRIRQRSADLRRVVQTILERDLHKYDLQLRQIKDTEKRDKYRLYGELLHTYGNTVPDGARSCELDNYYTGETITVPLDPTLTPMQNAQRYYERYNKLKRTHEALTALTVEVKAEIDQLTGIRAALDLADSEGDLLQIRKELEDSGLVRRKGAALRSGRPERGGSAKGGRHTPAARPLHYISSDGLDIYVGKNNIQNDELTFRFSAPTDIWFHANDMPGSHVILCSGGRPLEDLPDRAFEEAASLAAYYSAGREQGKVEIDYLQRRGVKKPGGARPGFVIYHNNYSILASTDISGLRQAPETAG